MSTLDLLGKDFVLFTGSENAKWTEAALFLKLPSYSLPGREQALQIKDTGAVLVRPDGFAAWRSEALTKDPFESLWTVMNSLLGTH